MPPLSAKAAATQPNTWEECFDPLETTSATLSNDPRSLHLLWQEYKYGINGRKPAEGEGFTREGRAQQERKQTKILSQKSLFGKQS